ncbi:MAG: DNA-processing protein DprA [Vampirovibrionales bacterium]|nr:DNA-processing protein DprA [Vampirovibrionales bacterium]
MTKHLEAARKNPPLSEALLPWLGLNGIDGLGPKTIQKLLAQGLSPLTLWEASAEQLATWQLPIALQLSWQQRQQSFDPQKLLQSLQQHNVTVLTLEDERYPKLLSEIYDPPTLLFVRGNSQALKGKTLGWVGTRKASAYGHQVVNKLISDLRPSGVTIISGLALGVDTLAHEAALREHLPTVAVLGCGIDGYYPFENKNLCERIIEAGGAVVSEYGPGVKASKFSFPRRNRIIAGLCYASVVVECPRKSGAMITAREASEEGRTVFAVPGNILSPNAEGPNFLLTQGATPLLSGEQLLTELNWVIPAAQPLPSRQDLPDGQPHHQPLLQAEHLDVHLQGLLAFIPFDPISIDALQEASGVAPAKLAEHLLMLELEGFIQRLPAAQVCRC